MTIFWVCILKKFIEKKFFPKNAEILRIYKKNFPKNANFLRIL